MGGLSVVRMGDMCSGHVAAPPRPVLSGSMDVLINNLPAVRAGIDAWAAHGVPPHGGVGVTGSQTVFVNGQPLMRVSDPISCGSLCLAGSQDTFAG